MERIIFLHSITDTPSKHHDDNGNYLHIHDHSADQGLPFTKSITVLLADLILRVHRLLALYATGA